MRSFHHNYRKKVTWTLYSSIDTIETQFPVFTRIQQKQSKQQCYKKFEAALRVERTVSVLTQGRPDSKRGAPGTSQPSTSQSSRMKGKKWTSGRGSGRGVASS